MDVPVDEVHEQLLRMAWELRISRDSLLQIAEALPSGLRERAQETAGSLMQFWTPLREMTASLPAEGKVPASLTETVANLHRHIEKTLRNVDLLVADVRELLDELYGGEDQASKIN